MTILLSLAMIFAPLAEACMSKGKDNAAAMNRFPSQPKHKRKPASTEIPRFAEGNQKPSLEARLGNMLLKFKPKSGERVVISIPVRMERSEYSPFGDGQTNAKMGFGPHWKQKDFPAVAVQTIHKDGTKTTQYDFHPSLNIKEWIELGLDDGWVEIIPHGWNDSFYFNFNTGVMKTSEFLKGIPENLRTFSDKRTAPNPERISQGRAYTELRAKKLGPGYNEQPWPADSVHGRFPNANGEFTALGGVLTWGIVDSKYGPFKHLYTCFESRNAGLEAQKGVPSGAGWHRIGDPAETLLNSLEEAPLPYAIARPNTNLRRAYELKEVITATWMNPDETGVTVQNEFHWYLNPYEREVCTEVWVHKCVPDLENNWGFKCG